MEQEKIIEKIRKVLKLANSNYEEEAHAALLKAQELIAQHGLTMAEVELSPEEDETKKKEVVDTCISGKQRSPWYEKNLAGIIGDNFRCQAYTTSGKGIYFIGLKDDVEIALAVYSYALKTMVYLAREYVKSQYSTSKGLKNDYMIGFLSGLKDKFKEQVASKGYALVLVKDALVIREIDKKHLRKGARSRVVMDHSSDARDTGYRDGRAFNEHQKMIQ